MTTVKWATATTYNRHRTPMNIARSSVSLYCH